MRSMQTLLALTLGVVLFAPGAVLADKTDGSVYRASKLIGKDVKNAQGENLGSIKDIVVDPHQGDIAYAVLSFGGFLGLGDKYFAIPWRSMEVATGGDHVLLNVDKERLKNAPGFDKDNWPNMASREWGTNVHKFYGQQPYWEGRNNAGTQRGG